MGVVTSDNAIPLLRQTGIMSRSPHPAPHPSWDCKPCVCTALAAAAVHRVWQCLEMQIHWLVLKGIYRHNVGQAGCSTGQSVGDLLSALPFTGVPVADSSPAARQRSGIKSQRGNTAKWLRTCELSFFGGVMSCMYPVKTPQMR